MLRVVVQRSEAAALGAYFAGGRGDYYAEGLEVTGLWQGEGAERLGLNGDVTREAFEALCRNEHPETGELLTPRMSADRRVGYDFTFNCPKSLSTLHGLTQAPELLRAFETAVADTMRELESLADTRVRKGGEQHERRTGNLLYARFTHTTARPVDGYPDPHLHAHCFVMNATFDEIEQRWKAVDLAEIKRRAPYFEAAFHSRLASALRDLGFDIAPTPTGWEIAGIPEQLLRAFSRRTEVIEEKARELGVTDAKEKDALGAKTRTRKRCDLSADELYRRWWMTLTPNDVRAVNAVLAREVYLPPRDPNAANLALGYAAEHHFERQSVVPVYRLLTTALRAGVGETTVEDLHRALSASGLLVRERDGRAYVTSEKVLREEQHMLAFARDGRGACLPLGSSSQFESKLSAEQQAVIRHLLDSRDRVMLIRGVAGTGKTALMREAIAALEANGKRVLPLAPSSDASRGVLRGEGFTNADTVARFLLNDRLQNEFRGETLWVDEAGLLGSRTVGKLFMVAERLHCQVILSGDERQHGAVERGAVFRLLREEAGLPIAEVTTIRRQSGRYREAAKLLSEGKVAEGLSILDALGWVKEVRAKDREQQLAAEYARALQDQKTALVVSPTHAEGRKITSAIREELRRAKFLADDERPFVRLDARGLTTAERRNPLRYRVGDVVEFHQNVPAFTKGGRYTVAKVGRNAVVVKDERGQNRILPFRLAESFEVYAVHELKLAVGDRLRVTKNGRAPGARLDNGALVTVTGFTSAGDIEIRGGAVIDKNYAHLAHGYVVTSHAAQGKTVDRVFVAQSTESFPASSREQFYVSATRAREQLLVYTDDKAGLRRAVQKSDSRVTATELVRPSGHHPAWLAWLRRRAQGIERVTRGLLGRAGERPSAREVSR